MTCNSAQYQASNRQFVAAVSFHIRCRHWNPDWAVWRTNFCLMFKEIEVHTKVLMPSPGQTGQWRHYIPRLFVHLSVLCLFAGLLPNFNTICRKWINQFWCKLAQVVSGARAWNLQLWESGGQTSRSYEAKVGNKNPFWQGFSRTIWQIFTKPVRHICHNNSDAKGESHKKPKIDLEAWWRHHFGPLWVE